MVEKQSPKRRIEPPNPPKPIQVVNHRGKLLLIRIP